MPTYSLTLRQPLGRKLTIQEVDNNWLYLQDLASQSGGGVGSQGATGPQGATGSSGPQGATGPSGVGVSIDFSQIAFGGTPSGLTSSSQFQFDNINNNLILGLSHSITGTTSYSVILGGCGNSFYNNDFLIGLYDIKSSSSLIGGYVNQISNLSAGSIIGGGFLNNINSFSFGSSIIGGLNNLIYYSSSSSILTGCSNQIYGGRYNSTSGGYLNEICESRRSVIIGGCNNIIDYQNDNSLFFLFFDYRWRMSSIERL
jgi:hypothetical protein